MHLSMFTDLALRIVMRLATLNRDQTLTTHELAEQLNVRYAHATKVVAALQKLGVVETRRGRTGGVWITPTGAAMSIGFIARELEGPGEVVDCDGPNPCPLRGGCLLRRALRDAQDAFFMSLDRLRVSDLVAEPTQTLLLTLAPPGR
ncbi:MAG: RrF2 family transcriptional regulator [Cumulibacter sp.]